MPVRSNHAEYMREYYRLNKTKWKKRHKVIYARDREKIIAAQKVHYKKNREKILERNKTEAFLKYRREWRKKNPEKMKAQSRRHNLKRRLNQRGITHSDYEGMKRSQNGGCAICGGSGKNGLHLDHDHKTNKVRGLLCCKCNLGVGYFQDDLNLLANAIHYLGGSLCP